MHSAGSASRVPIWIARAAVVASEGRFSFIVRERRPLQAVVHVAARGDGMQLRIRLAAGTVVALAVRDEASRSFSERADRAIEQLGGTRSLRNWYRGSYALIGVKGAPSGSALESASMTSAVQLTVGRPLAQRGAGIAFNVLELKAE
ncbi:MAG: hypothetical protein JWN04_5340 [Myxococcaceae bacterium]|nr:hypothetical protein [Myxococcaceae bacterium]